MVIEICGMVSYMQRNTVQRQVILGALIKLESHPAIEQVYAEVHKAHPAISKATVYRNLHHLARGRLIRRLSLPDGLERYDARVDRHYHFECKVCGGVFDVDVEYLDGLNSAVQRMYDFQVDDHDVVFSGTCFDCR